MTAAVYSRWLLTNNLYKPTNVSLYVYYFEVPFYHTTMPDLQLIYNYSRFKTHQITKFRPNRVIRDQ